MSDKKATGQREALLQEMHKIIDARVNDAVKLAYLSEDEMNVIDKLDLTALTEFKRSGNGAVEVKFNDKMKAMEQLLSLTEAGEEDRLEAILAVLGGEEPT